MSKTTKNKKTAIVLFNLGGPDNLKAVRPFLFNLFFDKNIIKLPAFFRYFIAKFIAFKRQSLAKEIYKKIGGKSPINEETQEQIDALKKELEIDFGSKFEIFMCMRHWHPMSAEILDKIEKYYPSEIILLPLYPQFSTTTAGSSIEDFTKELEKRKIEADCKIICCYPEDESFIKAHAELIDKAIGQVVDKENYRILFSAHGLPQKIVKSGDPYAWQVERTVNSILDNLSYTDLDYKVTYQSRVGPLEWLKPDTEEEVKLAAHQKKDLIIVPISFVSEHVETLVELDIEYKRIADKARVNYIRVEALRVNKYFINSLKNIIIKASKKDGNFLLSSEMSRICPGDYQKCPCNLKFQVKLGMTVN
jgi:ferrochelatase